MPQSSTKQFSGIFVSYRRDDSSGHAGRLFDKLVNHFGKERIFMDIDTIEPGEDFVTVIENAVGSCGILIAIIGRHWLSDTGETSRLLNNPNDFVRLEIATALSRDIRVIPVLVQRATMPKPQDLPDDMAKLTRRNAVELTDLRWQSDVDQLISVMERVLAKREEAVRFAEAARHAEVERQRQEEERRRVAETQLRLAEEEAKQRAADVRLREEKELERKEAEKRARHEVQEVSDRQAEEERVRAKAEERRRAEQGPERRRVEVDPEAEARSLEEKGRAERERHAAEARFRESNLAANQKQLDEASTKITAGDVSTPWKKNRLLVFAVASMIVLVAAVALIWITPRDSNSSDNKNQAAAAQPSKAKGDFSTPKAAVETFIAAAVSRDSDVLSRCFAVDSHDEFRNLREQTASQKDLDGLATSMQGAQVGDVREMGDNADVSLKFQSHDERLMMKRSDGEWKIHSKFITRITM